MQLSRRGFTLIEMMIGIAVFAVFLAIPATGLFHIRSLQREQDYRHALVNAEAQFEHLRQLPFDSLPPELVTVDSEGWLQLSQRNFFEDSVAVRFPTSDQPLEVAGLEPESGRVRLGPENAGQKVVVDYAFALPDVDEAHFLDQSRELQLVNLPLRQVAAVWVLQGEKRRPAQKYEVDFERGCLTIADGEPGSLILVDYFGGRLANKISGIYLDQEFRPTQAPSGSKLLTVAEFYGGGWRMSLPLVKARP